MDRIFSQALTVLVDSQGIKEDQMAEATLCNLTLH